MSRIDSRFFGTTPFFHPSTPVPACRGSECAGDPGFHPSTSECAGDPGLRNQTTPHSLFETPDGFQRRIPAPPGDGLTKRGQPDVFTTPEGGIQLISTAVESDKLQTDLTTHRCRRLI